jgi:hypothetical protein
MIELGERVGSPEAFCNLACFSSRNTITVHLNMGKRNGQLPLAKRALGRPTKYSHHVLERLCDALSDGMPIKGACVVAGIGVTTLSEWRERRPEIEQRIDETRELARQKALQRIKAAGEKDWRAHAEWLRLTFPADYRGNANKVEVQQAVQVQISQERLADIRSRLEHVREWLRSRDTSAVGGTRKNEEELDVEPSRQKLSDSADSALRPPLPARLDYAGQPIQTGEPYGGRP